MGNGKIVHSSCYDHFYYDGSQGQAWAWNPEGYGFNSPPATIAWRMYDPLIGMVQGTIDPNVLLGSYTNPLVSEIEVATYEINGSKFMMAAFYLSSNGNGVGHFYETFKWNPSSATFVPVGLTQLTALTSYTRISIDQFKGYAIALAWQEGSFVIVKTGLVNTGTGMLDMSNDILVRNSITGVLPDIAFGEGGQGNLLVRIAYLTTGGVLNVSNMDFYTVQFFPGGGMSFNIDDSWATGYNYSMWSTNAYKIDFTETYFQLDCPASMSGNPGGIDYWTVAYHDNAYDIMARSNSGAGLTTTNITQLYGTISPTARNIFPTLVYGTEDKIHFGWLHERGTPNAAYLGTLTNGAGTGMGADYGIISQYGPVINTTFGGPSWHDLICFGKEVETTPGSPEVFIAQATADPNTNNPYPIVQTLTKLVPVGSAYFRPTAIDPAASGASLSVYPNPSRDYFRVKGNDTRSLYQVSVWNVSGKQLTTLTGDLAAVNQQLQRFSVTLPAGSYFIRVQSGEDRQAFPVVKW